MSFTLSNLRADLAERLASAPDSATWTDALMDESIRQALQTYSLQGPAYEVDLEILIPSHEQDLAAIPDLLAIEYVAWPWRDGLLIEDCAVRWRRVGPTTIRFDRRAPQLGDTMRVRYRRAHTIEGLDSAATTTVIDAHRPIVATGAAAAILALRLRQISENPALPREAARELRVLRDQWEYDFGDLLERLGGGVQNPVWTRLGL